MAGEITWKPPWKIGNFPAVAKADGSAAGWRALMTNVGYPEIEGEQNHGQTEMPRLAVRQHQVCCTKLLSFDLRNLLDYAQVLFIRTVDHEKRAAARNLLRWQQWLSKSGVLKCDFGIRLFMLFKVWFMCKNKTMTTGWWELHLKWMTA